LCVRGLYRTLRFRDEGWERARARRDAQGGLILVLWHNVLMIPLGHECRRGVAAFISRGRDGEFAARVVHGFGVSAVRGSTRHAGSRALLEAVRGDDSRCFALTPDGPRGPRYSFDEGAAWLASRTGLPVVPIGVGIGRAWHLKTWDRYRIPKPFSRVRLVFGEPLEVAPDLDRAGIVRETKRLDAALREASVTATGLVEEEWPD